MRRRDFLLAGSLLLAACVTPGQPVPSAKFSSARISVTTSGSGQDVILIPGLGSSSEIWAETAAAVPGYRYHFVQVAGFAGAPAGENSSGLVMARVAEEIARYIREAGLSRPALIGHSMGGSVAMMVAARNLDAVSRLMVIDMLPFLGAFFGPPGTTADGVRATADALRDKALANTEEERRRSVEASIATMVMDESRRADPIRHGLTSDRDVAARAYHELITTDLRPELGKIRVPVKVLYVQTPNLPLNEAQFDAFYKASYAGLPQAELKRIPNSYHFIMFDQPQRFAEEVRAFLSR
jgi:pimeloyl-ACP methyl ester carboxylesterase